MHNYAMFILSDSDGVSIQMGDEGHEGSAFMFMLGVTQVFFSISMWEEFSDSLKSILGTTGAAFVFIAVFLFIQEKRIKKWNLDNGYASSEPPKYERDKHGNIIGIQDGTGYWNLKMMGIWAVSLFIGIPLIF